MIVRRLLRDSKATAAVEFALSLPMMLALLFGGLEAGHFFWTEHKLVKAVRDGARFAARSQVDDVCNGATADIASGLETDIRNLTVTGQIADGGVPKVPGWTAADVQITAGCQQFVATGIYDDLGAAGPLITISSGNVAYPSILNGLGFLDGSFTISANASAAVTGI